MLYKALISTLAAFGAAALVATGSAGAADDVAPVPCNGFLITDKAGDQLMGPIIGGPPAAPFASKGPDNTDIQKVFFNRKAGPDGNPVTTANIVITNLDKTVPEEIPTGRISYFVQWDALDNGIASLRVENDGGEISYHYVVQEVVGVLITRSEKDTTGRFIEGPMGVIEIVLPPEISGLGQKLENVHAHVTMRAPDENYTGYQNDVAPDEGATSKKTYTVADCPVAAKVEQVVETPVAPVVEAPVVQAAPAAAPAPVVKKASKRAACMKKAKKIKNKRKRAKAVKRCKKLKR